MAKPPTSALPTPNAVEQSFTRALGVSRRDRWEQAGITHYAHVPGDELDESTKKCPEKGSDPQQIVLYQVLSPHEEQRLDQKSMALEGTDGLLLKIRAEPSKRDGFRSFWLYFPMNMTSKESLHPLPPQPHLLERIYGIFLFSLTLCLFYSDHENPQNKVVSYYSGSIRRGLWPEFLLLEHKYYLDGNAEPTMFMTLVEKYALLCMENFDLNENVEWFVWKRRMLSTVSSCPRKISEGSLQNPEILVKSKSIQQSLLQSKTKDNMVCPTGGFPSSPQLAGNPFLPPSLGQGSHSRGIASALVCQEKNLFPIGGKKLGSSYSRFTKSTPSSSRHSGSVSQGVLRSPDHLQRCAGSGRLGVGPRPGLWKESVLQRGALPSRPSPGCCCWRRQTK